MIVQVPKPTIVAFVPVTVQTAGVIELNTTAFPLAPPVADNGISEALNVCVPGFANVIA